MSCGATLELVLRLGALPQLRELQLGYAKDVSSADAPGALAKLQSLTALKLLQLQCSLEGAAALASRVAALAQLRVVVFSFEAWDCESGSRNALIGSLAALSLVNYLSLEDLALNHDSAVVLASALKCMPVMQELYLPRNNIGPGGAKALGLHRLRVLELLRNPSVDEGMKALEDALPCMHARWRLGLGGCGGSGAAADTVLRATPEGLRSVVV